MKATRGIQVLMSGMLVSAVLMLGPWLARAQNEEPESSAPSWEENQQGSRGEGDQDRTREQIRTRIRERIQAAPDLSEVERAEMQANLDACVDLGVSDASLEAVFPGAPGGREISTRAMLQMQNRVRATAEGGLPVEPMLAKVQEGRTKGVPEPVLEQVCQRMENHLHAASRIMTEAQQDGVKPESNPRRERQMVQEMAQQMWRGTSPEDMDHLRERARERLRNHECAMDDFVAASETATRLREEGVEPRRAMHVSGEALRQGYNAAEMRQLQYMMMYRHREGRSIDELVGDFEYCLGAGMDAGHMYQHMMQHGWMGPGDMHGPGGFRPIDDQGHGPGHQGGGHHEDDTGGHGGGPGGGSHGGDR
jgi:hypothetical protein